MSATRWPRLLTPTHLAALIRRQKNSLTALHLFTVAPTLYPSYRHNAAVYSAIIAALSAPPLRLPHLTSILRLMLLDSAPCRDSVLSQALSALPLPSALSLFRLTPLSNCPSPSASFHSLLLRLLRSNNLPTAHALLKKFSNSIRVDAITLNMLMEAMCSVNRVDLAVSIFAEFKDQCAYPDRDSYRILMRGLCQAGRLDDAIHLLYSMLWRISQKGCEADVVVYRLLLDALCEDGRVKEAEEILGKVLKKGLRVPKKRRLFQRPELQGRSRDEIRQVIDVLLVVGGVRSVTSYGAVMGDLYVEGKFGDAERMFGEMMEKGFRPTVAMYEEKISALCGVGRAEDAAGVLEGMKERGCVPTVRCYNLVMGGLCEEGKAAMAVAYLEKMDRQVGCVATKETFDILVDGLCREGRFLEGSEMMERMVRSRCWPGPDMFNCMIRGLCFINRRYESLLWLEEMVSQGKAPEPEVWSLLVGMVCGDYNVEFSCWDALVGEVTVDKNKFSLFARKLIVDAESGASKMLGAEVFSPRLATSEDFENEITPSQ